MYLSVDKNLKPNAQTNLSQALKLAGTVGGVIASTEYLSKSINKKATQLKPESYLYGAMVTGLLATSLYGATTLIVPMWREITEYRPDENPFLGFSQSLSLHTDRIDDLYS